MMPLGYKFSEESKKRISDSLKRVGAGKWNLGRKASEETKSKMSLASKGKEKSTEHRMNISKGKMGEKHPLWKGEGVGYKSLHQWVGRGLGKAGVCYFCGAIKDVEWANKSHEYKRDLGDWIRLCKKCHHKYDLDKWGVASKVFVKSLGGLGSRK